jgi:uncharacterized protein
MPAPASPPISTTIIPIAHTADGPSEPVAAERVLFGHPLQRTANAYSSTDQAFHCGVWESDIGAWRVHYTEHEFCHMLAGRVRIIGDDGSERTVVAGDSFVIPAGFSGIWQVEETARKLYAIYEATYEPTA